MEKNSFEDYIFPVLVHLSRSEQHVIVRLAIAKNLATIANVAKKFIEKALEVMIILTPAVLSFLRLNAKLPEICLKVYKTPSRS